MKKYLAAVLLSMIFILTACSTGTSTGSVSEEAPSTVSGSTAYPLSITDSTGEVTIESEPQRIVSLAPSNTETVFALGAGDRLVGRTDYCNYPKEAESIPSIGSYSNPNTELILAQSPDLILATSIDDSIRSQLEATGAKVLLLNPETISQVEETVVTLGQVLNTNDKATEVVEGMQSQEEDLLSKLENKEKERTVFIDIGSFYSAGPGSFINNMLERIGAQNIANTNDTPYPQLSAEEIVSANPDVYISISTPIEELKTTPGFDTITAFKDGRTYYYEGLSQEADMIQRPSTRVIQGMELLAKDIYPECFENEE